jgi:hypothetical protein
VMIGHSVTAQLFGLNTESSRLIVCARIVTAFQLCTTIAPSSFLHLHTALNIQLDLPHCILTPLTPAPPRPPPTPS